MKNVGNRYRFDRKGLSYIKKVSKENIKMNCILYEEILWSFTEFPKIYFFVDISYKIQF